MNKREPTQEEIEKGRMDIVRCNCGNEKMVIEVRRTCTACGYYTGEHGKCGAGDCDEAGCTIYRCSECKKVVYNDIFVAE